MAKGASGIGGGVRNSSNNVTNMENNMFTSKEGTTVSFNSNAANNIMDIPVETRSTRANPRTQAALEKSESLTRLQNELNDAPVGTSFGFTRANGNVEVYEKVPINSVLQGWTRTTLEKNGSVAYGGGNPKRADSVDFVSTINTIKSISTPMTQADRDRYKRFRQDTDFSDMW